MTGERLCLIANPRSAAGATGRRLGALRRAADRHFREWDLLTTEGPGHATELASRAVSEGYEVVVAVGGDGTASEVVNGLFEAERPRSPHTVFSVIPAGTGSDLVKTLGMPRDLDLAMAVVATAEARPTDVTSLRLTGDDGATVRRIGINVTGFGMNGEVVKRANESSKRFGGTATFAIATLRALRSYVAAPVRLTWTDDLGEAGSWEGPLSSVFVANGHFCGGGMWIGRGGRMDDGFLDLTIIPDLGLGRSVLSGPRLFTGTLDRVKNVSRRRVRSVEATPLDEARILVDVDGEQPGMLPAYACAIPKVLLVRAQWPYAR